MSAVTSWIKSPFKNFQTLRRLNTFNHNGDAEDVIWAVKDVSFEIEEGEVVGIIGRNGAGKSTLLKILSRITEPTGGRAVIRGRVSSLLEVGTGFHPDLTGRENVYMNGTILGMTKREIDRKFDEIVDFSGVERFLDTPIKRYSSGMQVRLAFAVAAHLEPEILIVDEVLAVGDAEFQKKCLGKMQDVARGGRTVLFVSHNMAAVGNLCSRGIVLSNGAVSFEGNAESAVENYTRSTIDMAQNAEKQQDQFREKWCKPMIRWAHIKDGGGVIRSSLPLGSALSVEMAFDTTGFSPLKSPVMGVTFNHEIKGAVGVINTKMCGATFKDGPYTSGILRCHIDKLPLLQGFYTVDLWLGDSTGNHDVLMSYLVFEIVATDYYNSGQPPFRDFGCALLDASWECEAMPLDALDVVRSVQV